MSIAQEYDQAEIQQWREKHEEKFKSPTGWLALIGHHWLKEGTNQIAKDPNAEIPLPTNLSEECQGTIRVTGGTVSLETTKTSGIMVDGKSVTRSTLTIDNLKPESDGENIVTVGDRIRLQLVRRNNRLAIRVRDKESDLRQSFQGKKWFSANPSYCVEADFVPYDPPKPIQIINIRGEQTESELVGSLKFKLLGETISLDAISESEDELFILFKDQTNGASTYGPGRFLDCKKPVDGKVTLDFNKAYNPPCAFSPHTLCPLPPKQNSLSISIEAGERKP